MCVLGNKCDLRHERQVPMNEAQEYASSIGALYYETSALSNEGNIVSFKRPALHHPWKMLIHINMVGQIFN